MFLLQSAGATGAVAATTVVCYINDQKLLPLCLKHPTKAHPEDPHHEYKLPWSVPSPRHSRNGHEQSETCVEFDSECIARLDGPSKVSAGW